MTASIVGLKRLNIDTLVLAVLLMRQAKQSCSILKTRQPQTPVLASMLQRQRLVNAIRHLICCRLAVIIQTADQL